MAMVAGPAFVIGANQSVGLLLLTATTFALLALVDAADGPSLTTPERVALAVPAGLGLFQGLPPTLVHFAADAGLVTGLAVAGTGALVLLAVRAGRARWPLPTEVVGALALVAGPALVAVQFPVAGPVAGVVMAAGLVVIGTCDDRLALSMVGAAGLLAHVPWALAELFPGEARLPLLLGVVGALLVVVAVLLTRQAGRHHHGGPTAPAGTG